VQETSDLANYLLLLRPGKGEFIHQFETHSIDRPPSSRPDSSSHALIVEYCISESEKALQKLEDRNKERQQSLSPSVLRLIAGLGLVSNFVLSITGELRSPRSVELLATSGRLCDALFQYLSRPDCDQDQVDAVYCEVSALLPDVGQVLSIIQSPDSHPRFAFVSNFSKIMTSRRSRSRLTSSDRNGTMDLDDGFDTQLSQSSARHISVTGDRDWHSVASGIDCFRSCVDIMTYYVSCMTDSAKSGEEIPAPFVQHLVDLEPLQLLYGSSAVSHILGANQVSDSNLLTLLEHMAMILTDYDLGNHEVWLQACLTILGKYSPRWARREETELADTGREMYNWFLNVAFAEDTLSPRIDVAVLDLLFALLVVGGPDLVPIIDPPDDNQSVRMVIINSLDRGVLTNYYLADKLPILFRNFTLADHGEIFDEIFKRLALEAENPDNMAVRMLIFSRLAASCHTLLRRCVYHIFESAARLPMSQDYAAHCFEEISTSLGLGSEKELCRLFSSQLLYTWLNENKQPIESIPFSVFRYSTLQDLLRDVEDEAFAQAMTMSEDSSKALAKSAQRDFSTMLVDGFAKIAAYSFSEDAQRASRSGSKAGGGKIKYLGSIFGSDKFQKLLFRHYSRILGIFISTTRSENDSVFQEILSKEPNTKIAAAAFMDIRKRSASTIALPADQQPVFSAASLHEKIDRLCRRMGMPYKSLWTPAMYVFVLRYLLQKIHPSLGSLHACSVLRKIRLFVALSGDVPLSGYPLEMTLLALQPFLTVQQCADDAIGICQYLLEKGGKFLLYRLSFVAGFTVSSLISLRAFAASGHDNTTQEDEYRMTISRAEAFREWLFNSWHKDYNKSQTSSDDAHGRFKSLVESAYQTQNRGNGIASTPESRLLQGILEDRSATSPLLEEQVSRNIITLLCSEFNQPSSFREDIFGDDAKSAEFADRMWRSVHKSPTVSDDYLVWVGKVLGRAQFSGAWEGVLKHVSDQPLDFPSSEESENEDDLTLQSLSFIIRSATDILHSNSRIEVGLAEDSFRQMLTGSSKSRQRFSEAQIPSYLETALRLETADSVMFMARAENPTLADSLSNTRCDVTKWTQNIAISLAEVSGNHFLLSIRPLLQGVHSFAEKTLAPVLHVFLVQDAKRPVEDQKMPLISKYFQHIFESLNEETTPHARALLNCILYLRGQNWVHGTTMQDRQKWLDLNYIVASRAAEECGMHTTALLLAETSPSTGDRNESQKSRRRTAESTLHLPEDLLLSIYRNIDDPDSFYGVHQSTSLATVLERLDFENDGFNSLLFHGARLDSDMRLSQRQEFRTSSVLKSLTRLNLNGVAHILLQSSNAITGSDATVDQTLETSRKLEQWDIGVPDLSSSHAATLFRVFQDLHNSAKGTELRPKVDAAIQNIVRSTFQTSVNSRDIQAACQTLGALCEIDELLSSVSSEQFGATWRRMRDRNSTLEYEG
jgi:serine-protein kinase ATM